MADIFDEIDEDLKRDQMQLLWTRYGKIVMAAVAAIVLLVALRQGYTAWQTSQAEASASAYQQALQSDDVVAALEAQLGQLSDGYAMLAQFQIAAEQAANNDFAAAEASYLALASDASIDPLYQQAANIIVSDGCSSKCRCIGVQLHVCLIWRQPLDHGSQWRWRRGWLGIA